MAEDVLYSVADGVATITLNRPDRLNALNGAMYQGLMEAFDQTDRDDEVRAVVVTGAGRAFCAGADLSGGARTFDYGQDATAPEAHRDRGGLLVLRIYRSLKPVIAAINGPAVGVGITMTLPMDIRIMADSARVAFPFARRGIVPDGASSWFLPRIVGISEALEWCLTGRLLSSEEALAGGLVRTVCPVEDVLPLATRLAGEIAAPGVPSRRSPSNAARSRPLAGYRDARIEDTLFIMTYGNDAVGDLFIDIDEWRDSPRPHRYVHGGFEGTHTLFSCYFPPAEQYRGRFLQYLKGGSGGHETLLPFLAWTFPVAFDGLGTHSRGLTSPSAKRSPRCTGPASPSSPDRALSSLPSGVPRAPAGSSGSRSTEAH